MNYALQQLNDVREKLRKKQYYSAHQVRAFKRLRNKLLRVVDKMRDQSQDSNQLTLNL